MIDQNDVRDVGAANLGFARALVGELQGHAGHWRTAPTADRPTLRPPPINGAKP